MNRCLSTLAKLDEEGYSAPALARLADRRAFPPRLEFTRADIMEIRTRTAAHMSISGVQEKISLRLHRGKLQPVTEDGEYILKPIPGLALPRFQEDVPANENLTMQLAEQIYGIHTAPNACIRLANSELAYITRRFDRRRDGTRVAQEDFCQLMGKTPESAGPLYKYGASYEELGQALRKYCSAYPVELEKLFRQIVFNYAVANGDAHLKNFSLQQTATFGDYVLTPAYDLLCTKLHLPEESRLAIDLFAEDEEPESIATYGFVTGADLLDLASRFGLIEQRARTILNDICDHRDKARDLIARSFLSDEAKVVYQAIFDERLRALEIRG
ncbi:HipA domain-containing protein [Lujinxingia vulgaris]|uniref:HipA domain-containing protein n=1 Tax=Lujinxingia vulgaris TaxID=2600176 RepID=A0A5C6XD78_9DELT|nr:HipA domain-containing protein [Lujinxingia vulgaris]TXD37721.1 HipA domain-containing protein [Lujinxingia vulgaris]